MINNVGAVRRQFQAEAKRHERRAEECDAVALREYYRGRADEARAAASTISRLEDANKDLDPTELIERHLSHSKTETQNNEHD